MFCIKILLILGNIRHSESGGVERYMGDNRIKIIFACDDVSQYDSLVDILNEKYNIIYSANNSTSIQEQINK